MAKTVDFTKKIVCSDESVKVIQVLPVNYANENFKYFIVYERKDGYQDTCAVNSKGSPSHGTNAYGKELTFLNPEPEVVSSFYRNVYNQGVGDMSWSSREEADRQCSTAYTRVGIFETLKFDDGTYKTKFIEV